MPYQRVAIGNTVTIAGTKDYWILDTETGAAAKFDYKGCNQLSDAYLLENDGLTTGTFSTEWIEETTVKAIIDTPASTDISTIVYKVNALVKKVPGEGFINYYFFDLDGETGAYTYTQCNGGDFEWLDEFDGKICTVYLTALNAKSTGTECFWRLLPVKVVDEGFTFNTDNAPKFAVDYYALPVIGTNYMPGAAVELNSSISSELLGFENATLSYTSSNTDVVSISVIDGKLTLSTGVAGTATVTITGAYGSKEYSTTVTITVSDRVEYDSITVGEAISATNDTEVIVKGIVGPSAVNQPGTFYLIDETGAIPVKLADASKIAEIAIGNEIIVKGTRSITKDGGGQINIYNATVLTNYYGDHEYSTASFITGKTIDEVKAIADSPEATTGVYVVTAKITKNATTYSTTYSFGGLLLYSGGGAQYAWLDQFIDAESCTIELALCDWNAKGLKGCILAVITDDGKVYNELNFNS